MTIIYDVWFLRYKAWQKIFCHFGPFFTFCHPNKLKNQNFEKLKKTPGDTIILHKCIKNHDHMLYGSWDMVHIMCYFSFWAIFCPFTSLISQKIKMKKKNEKNAWRYHHFTQVYHKSWYVILFLRYGAWQM